MKKILFVDRDGTIIREPADFQIDSLAKLELMPDVIPALLKLQDAGFRLVMVTNQDGLGTERFPQKDFDVAHDALMKILTSQGIRFDEILICPHLPEARCFCRKPNLGLVRGYLESDMDRARSYVIGDRESDAQLAQNMGIQVVRMGEWKTIARELTGKPRRAQVVRVTKETTIDVAVALDEPATQVATGIGFFDHMLEQIARHGGIGLQIKTQGDLHIDEHHSVEDTAIALGKALAQALGDKHGIGRYGFVLPMDEAEAQVSIDLSGRAYFVFEGKFNRDRVGELSTEMVPHFFRSLAEGLGATIHVSVKGENTHHMVESCFKGLGRCLRQAVALTDGAGLPSTKGVL